jgi:hypothetical protein
VCDWIASRLIFGLNPAMYCQVEGTNLRVLGTMHTFPVENTNMPSWVMGKRAKKPARKQTGSKSNRTPKPKPTETTQIQGPSGLPPGQQQTRTPLSVAQPSAKKDWGHRIWKKAFGVIVSFIALLIGYRDLWPKVVIEPSQAIDPAFLSYQFTFENQPCYPIKISSVVITAVHLSWPSGNNEMSGMTFSNLYSDTSISGKDSITIKLDKAFTFPNAGKLEEGSKAIIKIYYILPLIRLKIADSALFEAGRDVAGNQIWLKRPLGKLANYKDRSFIIITNDP